MKTILAIIIFVPVSSPVMAQMRTVYDPSTGNYYQVSQQGNATQIVGSNPYTGQVWTQTVQPEGNQTGINAQGNGWSYDNGSGFYQGDGRVCFGFGAQRRCN